MFTPILHIDVFKVCPKSHIENFGNIRNQNSLASGCMLLIPSNNLEELSKYEIGI